MGSAAEILRDPAFWLGVLALVLALVLGYGAIAWVRGWSAAMRTHPAASGRDLEHYRRLREQGELSEQEFEQITRLLAPPETGAGTKDEGNA